MYFFLRHIHTNNQLHHSSLGVSQNPPNHFHTIFAYWLIHKNVLTSPLYGKTFLVWKTHNNGLFNTNQSVHFLNLLRSISQWLLMYLSWSVGGKATDYMVKHEHWNSHYDNKSNDLFYSAHIIFNNIQEECLWNLLLINYLGFLIIWFVPKIKFIKDNKIIKSKVKFENIFSSRRQESHC